MSLHAGKLRRSPMGLQLCSILLTAKLWRNRVGLQLCSRACIFFCRFRALCSVSRRTPTSAPTTTPAMPPADGPV
ncbi:hypothetical protein AMS68_004417 [Peltaster fructicola]|uniref:Uncharacterized protein n=1 Tax=Peltaster fructicola TaxID=286661 RepID=A0A6H0XWT8_9PEZI|nr:hypothetical protein AMS68_004417 [Peltaster fructicola]